MLAWLKHKMNLSDDKEELTEVTPLPYLPAPKSPTLAKRRYEEEQYAKYGISKERTYKIEILD